MASFDTRLERLGAAHAKRIGVGLTSLVVGPCLAVAVFLTGPARAQDLEPPPGATPGVPSGSASSRGAPAPSGSAPTSSAAPPVSVAPPAVVPAAGQAIPAAPPAPAVPTSGAPPTPAPPASSSTVPNASQAPATSATAAKSNAGQAPSSDDVLSPFEESPPASDDEQKVEAVVVVNPPPAKQRPVRLDRRLSLTGELGWNSLAGFGFNLGYHAVPQVTVEGGAGISLEGWRLGLRGRYNFTTGPATPFLGAGLLSSGGIEPVEVPSQEDENVTQAVLRVRPSKFIQTVFGVDWITREGFTVVSTLGWAWLLGGSNIEVLSGQPTPLQARGFRVFFGGGLVLSLALGYTFR